MDQEDIIVKILHGHDYKTYKLAIDIVNARESIISFEDLQKKFITRELIARSIHSRSPTPFPVTVCLPNTEVLHPLLP